MTLLMVMLPKRFTVSFILETPIMTPQMLIQMPRLILLMSVSMVVWSSSTFPKGTKYILHIYRRCPLFPIHSLHINWRIYLLVGNSITRLTLHSYMFPITITHIYNNELIGVIMGEFLLRVLLSSIHPHTGM